MVATGSKGQKVKITVDAKSCLIATAILLIVVFAICKIAWVMMDRLTYRG